MEIARINTYHDSRFSQKVLNQHGCFLVDDCPYEVEIISDFEAIVKGENKAAYAKLIEEFRFYSPHITRFFDENSDIIQEFPRVRLLTLELEQIQPSQFYVDEEKIAAICDFISKDEDIIIQVLPFQGRYISLDGHTRLYCAVMNGWESVRAVVSESDDWVYRFVEEAVRRNVHTPKDLLLLNHSEYEKKWNQFCNDFFEKWEV